MEELEKLYGSSYFIVPADCNAQREMPIPLLANKILDVATRHADEWGIGYKNITSNNHAWVLARLAIEMERYPKPYDTLIAETWVEDFNKHFSKRNFRFKDADGNIYGYARSVWFVIDLEKRCSIDISEFSYLKDRKIDIDCPIEPQGRIKAIGDGSGYEHKVRFGDIDFNGHFNSGKQIEHLLNIFPLDTFCKNYVNRFEISYMNEAHFEDNLNVVSEEVANGEYIIEMRQKDEGTVVCRSRVIFKDRNNN